MQRKYSEVVNYIPNFQPILPRRHHREVTNNHKIQPVDNYRPSLSPTINAHTQYHQTFTPVQIPIEITSNKNTTFENVQRRSLPVFNTTMQQNCNVNPPSIDTRTQNVNGYRISGLLEPHVYTRRVTQQNFSLEPVQYTSSYTISPQNIIKTSQIEMGQPSENYRRNISNIHSPNKLDFYHPKNNSFPSVNILPVREQQHRNIIITQNHRLNGRASQSLIFNEANYDKNFNNKINEHKEQSLLPLSRTSSNTSDLESTFSSEYNLSSWVDVNSPILSDPGSKLKKSHMFLNMKKDQQTRKSTIQPINVKNNTSQSKLPLNLVNVPTFRPAQQKHNQDNLIEQKKKIEASNKFQYKQKKTIIEFKRQPTQQLTKPQQFKFRKKNDSSISNNVVDLKQLLNKKFNPKQFEIVKKLTRKFTIQDFETIQKLGRGTYGEVFLVRQRATKFVCVIKSLSKKKIKQMNLQQLVFRQIKIQTYLVHKHIASLYGVFDDQNKIYLIMQCMPDGSMSSNGKKKISENQTAHLVHQVLEGLQFTHRQNIIHRDIKPQNLLLNNTYLKIGDFGCAVFGDTLRKTVVGCYAYISPEQFSNNPYDQKIDSWSVGILAYELLTGKPPYEQRLRKIALQTQNQNKNQQNIQPAAIIQFSQLTFPKQIKISAEAIDFIKRLLDPDPTTRAEVKEALKHKFLLKAKQYENYLQSKL